VDPLALLGAGELARDENDHPFPVAVGGHRTAAALTASHLDNGLAAGRHDRPGSRKSSGIRHVGTVTGSGPLPATPRREEPRHDDTFPPVRRKGSLFCAVKWQ